MRMTKSRALALGIKEGTRMWLLESFSQLGEVEYTWIAAANIDEAAEIARPMIAYDDGPWKAHNLPDEYNLLEISLGSSIVVWEKAEPLVDVLVVGEIGTSLRSALQELRSLLPMGLLEAKKLLDSGEEFLLFSASRDEAEKRISQLKALRVRVEERE